VPSTPPEGEPAPADGSLPPAALAGADGRRFSLYVHVPFCATRCGYCDFNTYTAAELGSAPGSSRDAYLAAVRAELALMGRVLGRRPVVHTVFFGGGTPTLLAADELVGLLRAVTDHADLAPGAEVTTEANPESVDPGYLATLVAGGFSRLSLGMQSAVPHVLAVLERRHTPGRAAEVVGWARAAGFGSISLDLIYGTPGETPRDWDASVAAALAAAPDHISAYSLIVEPGTRLAGRVRRGELPGIDPEVHADYYRTADAALAAAGLDWYEVSNWARPGHEARHNLAYWRSDDWWGIGPGAHSHVGGVRWWNVRHPTGYAARLAAGTSPAEAREVLSDSDRRTERVLLHLRLAEGLPLAELDDAGRAVAARVVADGFGTVTDGRLLADGIAVDLLG
jgi:oxygen-independent coproporphyrinogen-3 oxidase